MGGKKIRTKRQTASYGEEYAYNLTAKRAEEWTPLSSASLPRNPMRLTWFKGSNRIGTKDWD